METEEKNSKKQVRNYGVMVATCALVLGTLAGFMQKGNTFHALALLIVALVMIGFFALKAIPKEKKKE